jgi:hypothetical protein
VCWYIQYLCLHPSKACTLGWTVRELQDIWQVSHCVLLSLTYASDSKADKEQCVVEDRPHTCLALPRLKRLHTSLLSESLNIFICVFTINAIMITAGS